MFGRCLAVIQPCVDIVMTTYNSSEFLSEQLDSIIGQEYSRWHLLISDDGSSDGTREIIERYHARYGDKISDVTPRTPFHNVSKNVEYLFGMAKADYVMLSDHDDVWIPSKVGLSVDAALRLGNVSDRPLLIYTDLEVVDAQLSTIDRSLWHYAHLRPTSKLAELLFQNVVTGCTITLNQALINKSVPFPDEIFMYDWWIALVAANFGKMVPLSIATVRYRQHRSNVVGASTLGRQTLDWRPKSLPATIRELQSVFARRLERTTPQAESFIRRYASEMSEVNHNLIEGYTTIRKHSFLTRRYLGLRHGFFRNSLYTLFGMLMFL